MEKIAPIAIFFIGLLLPRWAFSRHMNILFLVVDDMRPQLGCYLGKDFPSKTHPKVHTPNIDILAGRSLLLKRAYVQQAWCSPSRTSLLTGRRPDTTHVYDLHTYFRQSGGNFTTIPQFFKERGYASVGMGKVFHPGVASHHDDPISWTEPYFHAPDFKYWQGSKHVWQAVSVEKRKQHPLPDEQLADHAIQKLRELSFASRPFFLAVGFHKPHTPFVFPEEFLSYYPPNDIQLPDNPKAPFNMPKIAWSNCMQQEFGHYQDVRKTHFSGKINSTLPDDFVKALRRAYYSSITYIDSLIGKVLKELDRLNLSNTTIVSLWGDHGWQLGEHGEWCKHTNFELATHAPMMVRIPGRTDNGVHTEALTEFVDLYPTLAEAAGFSVPPKCPRNSSHIQLCTEGDSLLRLLQKRSSRKLWKSRVFSQYPRVEGKKVIMGYSMRTDVFRYTEWVQFQGSPKYQPNWNEVYGVELYDHQTDPEENVNQAWNITYSATRQKLRKLLHLGWNDDHV